MRRHDPPASFGQGRWRYMFLMRRSFHRSGPEGSPAVGLRSKMEVQPTTVGLVEGGLRGHRSEKVQSQILS
jgi:hypothetical protein